MINLFDLVAGTVLLILVLWYFGIVELPEEARKNAEGYRSCRDCDGNKMPRNGNPVLNPFVWPYSGTPCVDDLYILNKDAGLDLGFDKVGRSQNVPDHVTPA